MHGLRWLASQASLLLVSPVLLRVSLDCTFTTAKSKSSFQGCANSCYTAYLAGPLQGFRGLKGNAGEGVTRRVDHRGRIGKTKAAVCSLSLECRYPRHFSYDGNLFSVPMWKKHLLVNTLLRRVLGDKNLPLAPYSTLAQTLPLLRHQCLFEVNTFPFAVSSKQSCFQQFMPLRLYKISHSLQ